MESVRSCCWRAIFTHDDLRSYSSPLARRVSAIGSSERFEFSNFGLLQNNKPIVPPLKLHAVPSSSQPLKEVLETDEEHQPQQTEVVGIQFHLQKDYVLGEEIFLVRKDRKFVAWDLKNAIPMTWSEGHRGWFAQMDVPTDWMSIQYKFIVKSACGDAIWQPGPHRLIVFFPTFKRMTICEEWRRFRSKRVHFTYPNNPIKEKTTDDSTVGQLSSLKPRFEFPTLKNKGRISLVGVVPPKPQDDYLEIDEEFQPLGTGQEPKFVRFQFELEKDYKLGEQLYLAHDYPAHAWVPMTWSQDHQRWFAGVDVPAGMFYTYMFVMKSTSGDTIWQPAHGHIVVSSKAYNTITICEEWGDHEQFQRSFRKSQATTNLLKV